MLTALERLERECNEGPPVHVEQADDGSLVWSGEAPEGEQGLLDDLQALVDARFGEWREYDDTGEL